MLVLTTGYQVRCILYRKQVDIFNKWIGFLCGFKFLHSQYREINFRYMFFGYRELIFGYREICLIS